MTLNWKVSKQDGDTITKIVDRAVALAKEQGVKLNVLTARMDIIAVHANGMPLRLRELADADDFNFTHDVFGIFNHIDRNTGKLTRFFVPRFARRDA